MDNLHRQFTSTKSTLFVGVGMVCVYVSHISEGSGESNVSALTLTIVIFLRKTTDPFFALLPTGMNFVGKFKQTQLPGYRSSLSQLVVIE